MSEKREELEGELSQVASSAQTWKSFLEHPGFALYERMLTEQIALRQTTVCLTPVNSEYTPFTQEYYKGEASGMIKAMDIPMVGTGVLGSAISMNKIIAKRLLKDAGLPVTDFVSFHYTEKEKIDFKAIKKMLGVPFMVKSASLGSSVGVSKVKNEAAFNKAVEEAFRYDDAILMEEFITGREIECAILGNHPAQASYPGEIVVSSKYDFYTFDAKYVDPEAVRIDVPAKMDGKVAEKVRDICTRAYKTLHCEDFARVDLFLTEQGKIYINEINTIPGFTNSSMFPMMWKERGLGFTELISKLLDLAQERYDWSKRVEREFNSSLKF